MTIDAGAHRQSFQIAGIAHLERLSNVSLRPAGLLGCQRLEGPLNMLTVQLAEELRHTPIVANSMSPS